MADAGGAAVKAAVEGGPLEFDPLESMGAYANMISQGAEGRVYEATYLGRASIIKQRFKKKYRHPVLDVKLTKSRLQMEARTLLKARKLGVFTPAVLHVDLEHSSLYLEKIEGQSIKAALHGGLLAADETTRVMKEIGKAVAKLHDGGIIHGDLTTSNLMLRPDGRVVVIDFGLSTTSILYEDKGVDLYVLERAFTSAHSTLTTSETHLTHSLFDLVMEGYRSGSKNWSSVFNRFAAVRLRGRKRTMVG